MASTLTVYPDANAIDGVISRDVAAPSDENWATIHDTADGNRIDGPSGNDPLNIARLDCSANSDKYVLLFRSFFLFDTSALGASAIVSAATLSIYTSNVTETLAGQSIVVIDVTPASNTVLANSDYTDGVECGTTAQSATFALSGLGTGAYEAFALNAVGYGNVSLTGISKYGIRLESDRADSEPTWGNGDQAILQGYYSGYTGTDRDPKLVITYITYTISVTVGVFALTGIASIFTKGLIIAGGIGSFTLTGVSTALNVGRKITTVVGSFILTGINNILKLSWRKQAKPTGSWSKVPKDQ